MLNGRWLWTVCAVGTLVSGCMLNRSAIGCGDTCPDSGMGDAMVLADGDLPDAGIDTGVDAFVDDAGPADSGPDVGVDAFVDDGVTDAGMPDSGHDSGPSFDTCSDETGICLHFRDVPSSPTTVGWMVNVIWTHAGGTPDDHGWAMVSCNGGLRVADSLTTECLMDHPSGRPSDAVGPATVYLYPVYAGMVPACSLATCSNFPSGYTIWTDTVMVTGLVTEPRSGTPAGRISVIRIMF